jgi:hypothetical protein
MKWERLSDKKTTRQQRARQGKVKFKMRYHTPLRNEGVKLSKTRLFQQGALRAYSTYDNLQYGKVGPTLEYWQSHIPQAIF